MTTRTPGPMLTLDARYLAPTWLSVALAASTVKDDSALYRAVHVEVHATGLRLTATNRRVLLTGWVPALGHHDEDAPELDEAPKQVIVARDIHSRADGLMRHVWSLVPDDEADEEPIGIEVGVGEPEEAPMGSLVLAGLDGEVLAIDVPGRERLRVPTYEGEWLNWRRATEGFVQRSTRAIAFDTDILRLLSRLGPFHGGAPLVTRYGGTDKMARVEIGDPPLDVWGVVMPIMWVEGLVPEPEPGATITTQAWCDCGESMSGTAGIAGPLVNIWVADHNRRGHVATKGAKP